MYFTLLFPTTWASVQSVHFAYSCYYVIFIIQGLGRNRLMSKNKLFKIDELLTYLSDAITCIKCFKEKFADPRHIALCRAFPLDQPNVTRERSRRCDAASAANASTSVEKHCLDRCCVNGQITDLSSNASPSRKLVSNQLIADLDNGFKDDLITAAKANVQMIIGLTGDVPKTSSLCGRTEIFYWHWDSCIA